MKNSEILNGNDPYAPYNFNGECGYGVTIREQFAAMALQGMLASGGYTSVLYKNVVQKSVEYADALIDELNKENEIEF